MPLISNTQMSLLSTVYGPNPPDRPFMIYYASIDPATGKMWCPDCLEVEDIVREAFTAEGAPTGIIVWVGDKPTWKNPNNEYRVANGITGVPTIVKIQDGKEAGRWGEGETTKESLQQFLSS